MNSNPLGFVFIAYSLPVKVLCKLKKTLPGISNKCSGRQTVSGVILQQRREQGQ